MEGGGVQVAPGCPASEASRVFFAPQARKFWDFEAFSKEFHVFELFTSHEKCQVFVAFHSD